MEFITVLVLFLFLGLSNAQESDTLVTVDEATFSSLIEEETIRQFMNNGTGNYLNLFLSSSITNEDELKDYSRQFNAFYSEFNKQKVQSLSENKKIKTIYKSIHERFFMQYAFETMV
ncbi:MAG: hypothetical protein HC906_17280, partial [Bacteroidales bacterium]|nr:hypothetical protein [Bacteroidales bacterium]